MEKIQMSSATRGLILSAIQADKFYIPSSGTSVAVNPAFFAAVAGKTVEIEILTVGDIGTTGRVNGSGFATSDVVVKGVCTLKHGDITSEVRLHLADIVALASAKDGKAAVQFGVFQPEGKEEKYLVPKAKNRATASEITEFLEKAVEVTA